MGDHEEHALLRDRADELTVALAAASEVNQHLAHEVERLALDNDSLAAQVQRLKKRLKPHPATLDVGAPAASASPDADGDAEQEAILEADWAQLRSEGAARGWLLNPRAVELGPLLGEGGFGNTYKGLWRGAECAVKQVRPVKGGAEAFSREVTALSLVRHPNVCALYGACVDPPNRCWLVCELLPGGTLAEWLYGRRSERWMPRRTLLQRLRALLDVAAGMEALEQHDPPILHRDLKPANVLMSATGTAKVADFGLARVLTPEALVSLTPETGSYLYMCPEAVRHEPYATQADVWSWACLAVEVLTSARPYAAHQLTPVQVALAVADGQLRPEVPRGAACPPPVADLLEAAFDPDPLARPSFAVVVAVLRRAVAEQASAEAAAAAAGGGAWQRWLGKPARAASTGRDAAPG